ncbi:hypothetical protein BDS110ZK18_77920 [Bradyrhizobium diazoefficiens]|uniref:Uncharacterized protein n=1 Tax=Bradyrhizobium diazoefficiens TaxID=1355477 RepID=A0A809Y425_9BRAD|nr:hypothetical protein XF2B_73340 [Bradyrhizobium diazoefficiens]
MAGRPCTFTKSIWKSGRKICRSTQFGRIPGWVTNALGDRSEAATNAALASFLPTVLTPPTEIISATFIQFGFTSSREKVETEVDGRHGSLARHA